jgi:dienelactone hydrolase
MITFNTQAYVENLLEATSRKFDHRKAAASGDWAAWQSAFRRDLKEALGLTRIQQASHPALPESRLAETKEFDTFSREKRYLTAEPGIEIPFYLLLPKQGRGPFPLALTPHGHGRRGKEVYVANFETEQEEREALAGDRDIARQAVSEGYAVIAPDVRGFWEMAREEEVTRQKNNSCEELQKRALLFGRTLIGERVHDMGRLIDYAATRPEIDTGKIVITGNSGGGTVSLFTAALDDRISLSVPGSYFCTFEASILSVHHCPCNTVPGVLRLGEMYDIAGLIAPRPVLMVNGAGDQIFPIEATRAAFSRLQEIYHTRGVPDRCELFVGDGGHRYYKERVWDFVREHLKD